MLIPEDTQNYLLNESLRAMFLKVKNKECLGEDRSCNCKEKNNSEIVHAISHKITHFLHTLSTFMSTVSYRPSSIPIIKGMQVFHWPKGVY